METVSKQYDLPKLQRDIAGHLNKEEMRSLCFEMGIADEDLPSETLTGMARELVKYCQRREWIPNLLKHLTMSRPDFDWNKFQEAVKEVAIPHDFKEEHPELGYCIFWGGGQYGIEPTPPSDAIEVEGKITVETESHHTDSNIIAFWLEDGRLGTLQIHASLRGNEPKRWPIVSFSGRWWVKNLTMIKFRYVGEQG